MSSSSSSCASYGFSDSELHTLRQLIAAGLSEDVGSGDITTLATISDNARATATFLAKQDGVLSGISIAEMVIHTVDHKLTVQWTAKDGDVVKAGTKFGTVHGKAYSILVAERLTLNILQRMSGIATTTRHYVEAMGSGHQCKVLDTRKTAPGMRLTDKLAVKHGGGENHRFGLYDMFLVKDNHIDTNGGVRNALAKVKLYIEADLPRRQHLKIEIEARTLSEVSEILSVGGVDRILLDNMVKVKRDHDGKILTIDTSLLEQAVTLVGGKIKTEASGNVNLETIAAIAKTGVDFVSVGALTHSVNALDISLKISDVE